MAGILNVYELNKRGHKVTVVDAHELAQLTSAHTTAKLTLQHFTPYQMLLKNIGKAEAKLYHESQLDGIKIYRQLIEICIEEGVTFYQSTPVKYIEGNIAYTDQHEITFDHVVMASREVVLFCTYCDSLLKYNNAEESWDCPSDGFRFDQFGEVLHGPSVEKLKKLRLSVSYFCDKI